MKIQLKRSNVLEGGEAKKPSAAQMEYGELAVNYNANDPVIFLKDSNNQIISININNIGSIDSGTLPPNIGNNVGDLYFDINDNQLLFWNGSSWVPLNTNLGYTPAPTKGTVTNSSGTDADIPLADSVYAGLLSPEQYTKLLNIVGVVLDSPSNGLKLVNDKLSAEIATTSSLGTVKVGSGLAITTDGTLSATAADDFLTSVNLGYIQESDHNLITNDAGTGVRLELANTSLAGLMSPQEHLALYNLSQRSFLEEVNLSYQANGNGPGRILNSAGNDATIPIVNSAQAGLMSGVDKSNLDILVAGGGSGGGGLTNVSLDYIVTSTGGTMKPVDLVGNLVGSSADIPLVNNTQPGLMDSKDYNTLKTLTPANDGVLTFLDKSNTQIGTFSANQANNSSVYLAPITANTINSLHPLLAICTKDDEYVATGLVQNVDLPGAQSFSMPVPPEANAFYTISTYRVAHAPNTEFDYGDNEFSLCRLRINPYIQFSGRGATLFGSPNDRFGISMGGVLTHRPMTGTNLGDGKFVNYYWGTRTDFFTCTPGSGEITFTFRAQLEEANSSRIFYNNTQRLQIIPMVV